jgi:hypothetical protein
MKEPAESSYKEDLHAREKVIQKMGTGCNTQNTMLALYERCLFITKKKKHIQQQRNWALLLLKKLHTKHWQTL